jgi:eukaryotic-like serine/threonine-protein kinase
LLFYFTRREGQGGSDAFSEISKSLPDVLRRGEMKSPCPACGAAVLASGHCPACIARISLTEEDALPEDGRAMGDYELFEEIGRGGMGVVYRARQVALRRDVALKMLLAGEFASPEFRERFRKEAEVAARLRHPGIVTIYEIGEENGQLFFTMELVAGRHLGEVTRGVPMLAREAAAHVRAVAMATHYAHGEGVLHRDLKPSNILVDSFGQPKVADFGLARADYVAGTKSAHVLGSPPYVAPEIAAGKSASVASDVYALGAVLYHLITGRAPFHGENVAQVLAQVREGHMLRPRHLNPAIPADLETICLCCLSLESHARYHTAQAVADDLAHFLADEPIAAKPPGLAGRAWRWCRRKPAIAALLALSALLIVALVYGSLAFAQHKAALEHRAALLTEARAARESAAAGKRTTAIAALREAWRLKPGQDLRSEAIACLSLPEAVHVGSEAIQVPDKPGDSADGKWTLVFTEGTLSITERKTGREASRFPGFASRPPAQLDDKGRRIAIVRGSEVIIYDLPSGTPVRTLQNTTTLKCLDWSGELLAAGGSDDRLIHIWNAGSGERLHRFSGHDGEIESVRFRPDGQELASLAQDGTIRIWHAARGVELLQIDTPFNRAGPAWWSAGGTRLHAPRLNGSGVDVFKIEWPRAIRVLAPGSDEPRSENLLASLSLSGDSMLAATVDERSCRVWSLRHGRVLATFPKEGAEWMGARLAGDDALWLSGWNRALRRVEVISSAEGWNEFGPVRHSGFNSGPLLVAADKAGAMLALTSDAPQASNDRLEIVSTASLKTSRLAQPSPYSAAFSPDGRLVATGSFSEHGTKIWNVADGKLEQALAYPGLALGLVFSGDGKELWVCGPPGVQRFRTKDWRPAGPPDSQKLNALALSPTGEFAASLGRTDVILHRTDDLKEIARLPVPPWAGRIGAATLVFSPDGRKLVLHAALGSLVVWEIPILRAELAELGMGF